MVLSVLKNENKVVTISDIFGSSHFSVRRYNNSEYVKANYKDIIYDSMNDAIAAANNYLNM